MAEAPILVLEHVKKHYETAGAPLPVLQDIDLSVASGETIAIVGPSGSGKSTLLNLMGTLDRPSSGTVILEGRDLARLSEEELAWLRVHAIGFVFQLHHLLPQCTVLENVLLPALPAGVPLAKARTRAFDLLNKVDMGARAHHKPGQLSVGERQRAAVVRAMINSPRLLLADEPTGSLDSTSAQKLTQLLVDLNEQEKVALILVTHSLDLARRMGRVLHLKEGRLL